MDIQKEQLLTETYERFLDTGMNSPESLDILDELASPDIMGFGTTIHEKIFSLADLKQLLIKQRMQTLDMPVKWHVTPVLRKILQNENAALYVDEVDLEIETDGEVLRMALRYSMLFEYQGNKWVAIHFHGSKPEDVKTEEDTFGIEEWKKKNLELEKLVEERTAALEQSLAELKATQAQLIQSEKMASLGELTAGIAHEIQNPLNFVTNFSEVSHELVTELVDEVEKGNISESTAIAKDVQQNLEKVLHHGKRADAIVKGMLLHSRSSSGVKEQTDINALADEYLRLAYHGLRAKDKLFNATMKTDFDPGIGTVSIIPQDIGRVILNLITNAFYAVNDRNLSVAGTAAGEKYEPVVSVSTRKKERRVEVSVKDNGNGIPQMLLDKIFQPFFTTKPTGQGTGLGLSMSYDIVTKAHGGEIKVETKENEGTCFTIILPV